jgi:adenine-specific DNA-methyltransferase
VYQELTQGSCFALDNKGEFMVANTGYLITGSNLQYLIKLLNSNCIEFIYKHFYATMLGENGIRWLRQNIVNLPIPLFTNTKLQQQIANAKETDNIESLIYSLYELSKDEIEFIEQTN